MAEYKVGSSGEGADSELSRAKETFKYIPTPPKPGEMMHCRDCGAPMPPSSFPKSAIMRKLLFKWQLCEGCWNRMNEFLDRSTSGLLNDRSKGK